MKTGLRVDNTGAIPTISGVHNMTHKGVMSNASRLVVSLSNSTSIEMLVQVGDVPAHLRATVAAGGTSTAFIYEGTTFSGAGTPVSAVNKNRVATTAATVEVTHTPTITLDGTLLSSAVIPGGGHGHAVGGQLSDFEEWVLAPNTVYLVRLTNVSGGAVPASVNLDWYEPKNG